MNIFAGFILYGIKPMHAPQSAARIKVVLGSATKTETMSIVTELIADTPTASPSSPSIRLTALVQPTIHSTVSGMASAPMGMVPISDLKFGFDTAVNMMPQRIATSAAMICIENFIHGLRLTISSTAPMTAIISAPSRRPITCVVKLTNSSADMTKPINIATPPMRGIGWSCTRRPSLGTSIAPTFSAKPFTGGVIKNEMIIATAKDRSTLSHTAIF